MTLKRNVAVVKSIIRAKWRLAQAPIILSIMFSAPLMTTNTSFRLQDTPPDVVFFFNFFTRCQLAIFFYIPRRQIHLCLFFYVKNWTLSFRVIFDVNRETEKLRNFDAIEIRWVYRFEKVALAFGAGHGFELVFTRETLKPKPTQNGGEWEFWKDNPRKNPKNEIQFT